MEAAFGVRMGYVLTNTGRLAQAKESFEFVQERAEQLADKSVHVVARFGLTVVALLEGRLHDALHTIDDVLALAREVGPARTEALALGYRGLVLHFLGRLREARVAYEASTDRLGVIGDRRSRSLIFARMGALLATQGCVEEAGAVFAQAEQCATTPRESPARRATLDLHRAHLSVTLAQEAEAAGRLRVAARHRSDVHAALVAATESSGELPPLTQRSDDVQLALRLLRPRLEHTAHATPGLAIARDGSAFRSTTKGLVALHRRPVLVRALATLAQARATRPGEAMSAAQLVGAVWPTERTLSKAVLNRLYVAMTTLRKMGLSGTLLSHDNGWYLDPNTSAVVDAIDE